MIQINIYRVSFEANHSDMIGELMQDVRAADSYQQLWSAMLDVEQHLDGLAPGKGILVWMSEEESDEA